MRYLFILLLLTSSSISWCQMADKFNVGDYADVFNDSVKIFFNQDGNVSSKSCASFYRVGKMNATVVNVEGEFTDYYLNGNRLLTARMKNGMLEGSTKYFYQNGNILAEGFYKENLRDSKWILYFENGKIEKVINYVKGIPEVVDVFTKTGEQTVTNGNGQLETEFGYPDQAGKVFISKGQIVKGKMNGRWQFIVPGHKKPIGYEDFREGAFISGYPDTYTDRPRIGITRYYANENTRWFDNIGAMCPSTTKRIVMYNGWGPTRGYFKELEDNLTAKATGIANQWFFVGMTISKKNIIKKIDVASSINDQAAETALQNILKNMKNWEAAKDKFGPVDADIFFTIFVDGGKAQVPSQILFDRFAKANRLK